MLSVGPLLAALAVASAVAASQPPPGSGNAERKQPEHAAHPNSSGAPSSAVSPAPTAVSLVENAASPEGHKEKATESAEHWWSRPDWWIAGLTFVLAFATWRLVQVGHCFGEIKYVDVFKKERRTRFRLLVTDNYIDGEGIFKLTKEGNDAD